MSHHARPARAKPRSKRGGGPFNSVFLPGARLLPWMPRPQPIGPAPAPRCGRAARERPPRPGSRARSPSPRVVTEGRTDPAGHPPRPEAVRNTPHHGSEQLAPRARPRPHPSPPRPPRRGRSGRRRRPRLGAARHRLHRRRRPRERPGADGGLLLLAVHLRRAGPGRRHRLLLGRDLGRDAAPRRLRRLRRAAPVRAQRPRRRPARHRLLRLDDRGRGPGRPVLRRHRRGRRGRR